MNQSNSIEFDNYPYPKAVVCEAVDDWISEAIGHSQPMNTEINAQLQFVMVGGGMEVTDQHEGVEGQPAHPEHCHHDHQHLHHLSMEHQFERDIN